LPNILGDLFIFVANVLTMRKEILPEHQELLTVIGKKIKELRTSKNITYMQLAKDIGMSRNTYNLLEHGKHSFQITTLLLVLNYHGISMSKFFEDL
jgi:DNA-binding XRE family transcriptional regulator